MLKQITLALNNLEPETWTRHEAEDFLAFLVENFGSKFPDNGRIFHGDVSQANDVTPHNERDIQKLAELPGPFYVVVFPEGPVAFLVAGFLLAAAAYVLLPPPIPQPPNALARNSQASSPNNELSARTNTARINGRIPDIYGFVRSTPDLIAAPYKIFENGKEKEFAYMCIGRGPYQVEDVRDGETLIKNIPGATVEIYEPYTSPNSGDAPQLRIGTPIASRVLNTKRNNSVNGQVLRPPRAGNFVGNNNIQFVYPNIIKLLPSERVNDFTKTFVSDDEITITNADIDGSDPWSLEYVKGTSGFTLTTPKSYTSGTNVYELGTLYITTADRVFASWIIEHFQVGETITLTQNSFRGEAAGSIVTTDLSGTYEIDQVTVKQIFLDELSGLIPGLPANFTLSTFEIKLVDPASVNADWNDLTTLHYTLNNDFSIEGAGDGLTVDLNGTYTVLSVTENEMLLDNPESVAADWAVLGTNDFAPIMSPTIVVEAGPRWVGPFILDESELNGAFFNFVAQAGLYKDDGVDQVAFDVEVQMKLQPVDLSDNPTGPAQFFSLILPGSAEDKETVARTATIATAFIGRCRVWAARITPTDEDFEGTVVDEVRWKDVYSIAPVNEEHFGNITTVMTVTFSTASALAVKERKLNMLVKRKVPTYVSGAFTTNLAITQDAALILAAVCRDRYIGNQKISQFDMANFIATCDDVEDYFGSALARQFNYTFDKDNLSFEEIVQAIANAVYCVAYRRGSVIKLSFEKETENSVLLFNHRNKIPGSEVRSFNFGFNQNNDGIQYSYVDPFDDSINTIFLPENHDSINPKRVESVGIRSHLQAYFHVWRMWNKMRYQNTTVQFDACQEADLLVNQDRILVTDGTRNGTQDGEVLEVDGTELTLSQKLDLLTDPPYTIFLQHIDGTVENIPITAGTNANQVVLASAPALALVTDPNKSVRTGFIIVGANDPRQTAFLVSEKSPSERMIATVKGYNYDLRYYENDKDLIKGIIDEDAYGRGGGYTPAIPGDTGYPQMNACCEEIDTGVTGYFRGYAEFGPHEIFGSFDGDIDRNIGFPYRDIYLNELSKGGSWINFEMACVGPDPGNVPPKVKGIKLENLEGQQITLLTQDADNSDGFDNEGLGDPKIGIGTESGNTPFRFYRWDISEYPEIVDFLNDGQCVSLTVLGVIEGRLTVGHVSHVSGEYYGFMLNSPGPTGLLEGLTHIFEQPINTFVSVDNPGADDNDFILGIGDTFGSDLSQNSITGIRFRKLGTNNWTELLSADAYSFVGSGGLSTWIWNITDLGVSLLTSGAKYEIEFF